MFIILHVENKLGDSYKLIGFILLKIIIKLKLRYNRCETISRMCQFEYLEYKVLVCLKQIYYRFNTV